MKYDFANLGSDLIAAVRADPVFPIRIKMSAVALEELAQCEWGSWEDHKEARGHPCEIAQRHKGVLVLDNAKEADRMYYAVCSGTFQLNREPGEGRSFFRTACRIADVLRPFARPETVKQWPFPTGY